MRTYYCLLAVLLFYALAGCAGPPVVPIPSIPPFPFQERDARLISVEVKMPVKWDRRSMGWGDLLLVWRQEIETFLRDKKAFRSDGTREVRLVMNPLVFSETGVMANVRIVMDYLIVDSSSGGIVERYQVESTGYSGRFDGLKRSRDAWEMAAQSNTTEFLRRFAKQEVNK